MKIDKNLLPMKGHYFLFNAGTGLVIPFLPTLAKDLGFSSVVVGMVYTLLPILGLIAKPTMGALADKLHWQKGMFLSFIFLTMSALVLIPWIPSLPSDNSVELHCDAESVVKMCSSGLSNNICVPEKFKTLGNDNITCSMECEGDSGFIEAVCSTWNQPQYCAAVREPNNHMLKIVEKNLGVNRTNVPAKFIGLGSQNFDFSAILLPQHVHQLNNCLFIEIGEAHFSPNNIIHPYCNKFEKAQCEMKCNNEIIEGLTRNPKIKDKDAVGLYQFWLFCISLVVGWVSMAIVVSISDAICFELLGDFPSKYGNQRLWGSLGWGLFSSVAGYIIDHFSDSSTSKNYKPVFILMIIVMLSNLVVAYKLKYKQVKSSASIINDIGKLLSEGRVLIFLLWCIGIGMCTAMVWNFLFWFLEDLAAKNGCGTQMWIKTLEGLVMLIQTFGGELPFFFLSGWVLKKIGHIHSMSLVLLSFGVRFLLYSLLIDPWWVLPIEFLNGLTFGLAYASMASYASIVAPPGTEATTQGLVGAVFEGLGVSLGSFIGGLLFDKIGGSAAFQWFGIAAAVSCFLHSIAQHFIAKRTTVLHIHEKDFKHTRYASPNDAIHMLEDTLQDLSPR
ncbi:major facilitator superfamily domain-containing protein 6 isoform X2 [Halyomorpha halys]|uniref:major facilitator superfamily domain-containing protein 6 isoform X2 n=1 Tax=Halyomorpha halys TaxID=286706 RepID=UPI0006D4DAE1|nr:uncharacterized protein LOC106688059 isoform X2 [Halyomorpha halys]